MQPMCLNCHGEKAVLAPGVQDALNKIYPDDKAVGYKEGDLRGAWHITFLKQRAGQQ